MYKKFTNPEYWTNMKTKPEYKIFIDGFKRIYNKCSKKTSIGFSKFTSYRDTGLREGSDGAYFERERYFHKCQIRQMVNQY